MIDLKRNLFKIDVRAQKDEEKVFMRMVCYNLSSSMTKWQFFSKLDRKHFLQKRRRLCLLN